MLQPLFHVSEQSDIQVFEPRMPPTVHAEINFPVVWAVDHRHLANYLVPRECPRVCFHRQKNSSADDCELFIGNSGARHVVAIEASWLERTVNAAMWVYEFAPEPFTCADATAGYFVSPVSVTPRSRRRVESPLAELVASGVELRVVPYLTALATAIGSSSLAFSCIRMRNAIS